METTNFNLRISKAQAEELLRQGFDRSHDFEIMCKEYGASQNECDCGNEDNHSGKCDVHSWNGIYAEDLNDDGTLDDDYQTFEIWFNPNAK